MTLAVSRDLGTAAVAARVAGLRKVFGSTVAVGDADGQAGIDLDIPDGAVLGMLGPNGSGKTTLIRMLLGLTRPTAGDVELLGRPMPESAAACSRTSVRSWRARDSIPSCRGGRTCGGSRPPSRCSRRGRSRRPSTPRWSASGSGPPPTAGSAATRSA